MNSRILFLFVVTMLITLLHTSVNAQTTPNYVLCEQLLHHDVNIYHYDGNIQQDVYDSATLTKLKRSWDFSLFSSNVFVPGLGPYAVTLTEAIYDKDANNDSYCRVISAGWQTPDRSDNAYVFSDQYYIIRNKDVHDWKSYMLDTLNTCDNGLCIDNLVP
jgi:hypothetical protein